MGRAGRRRKQGKRTKSGRLSRAGAISPYDKGSEWVQGRKDLYGDNYNSAIGRAYASGLLDDPENAPRAKERYDAARKLASLYGRIIGKDNYRCALDRSVRGGEAREATEKDVADQEWLLVNLARIDNTGCRPFFDQLCDTHRTFTDYGPPWLERLLGSKDRRDRMVLDAAIKAIDAIGPVNGAVVRNVLRDVA